MTLPTISPSQLKTYTDCPRKWAFGKFDGLYPKPSPAAEKGQAIHTLLEHWLRDATPIMGKDALSKVAVEIARHLPPPKSGFVETAYHIERGDGLVYSGRIDFMALRDGEPVVYDHKTTSALTYALDSEDLLTDFQSVQYAAAGFLRWPGAEKVKLQWTYGTTKGTPQSLPVTASLTREQVTRELEAQDVIGRELIELHRARPVLKLTAADLPGNTEACTNFGGCPFYGRNCNPHHEREKDTMAKLKDRLAEYRAKKEGASASAPPPPPETNAAPPAPVAAAPAAPPQESPKVNPPKRAPAAGAAPAPNFRDTVAVAALKALSLSFGPSDTPEEIAERCYYVADAFVARSGK